MEIIEIHDAEDPRLDPYRQLKGRSFETTPYFICEGEISLERLLRSHHSVQSIVCTKSRLERICEHPRSGEVPIYLVEKSTLSTVCDFAVRRGCMACGLRQGARPKQLTQILKADQI